MAKLVERAMGGTRWQLPCVLGLALFVLSPVLRTGYYSDDAANSLLPGVITVHGYSPVEYVLLMVKHALMGGRFFPLHVIYLYTIFQIINNVIFYKMYIVACVIIDLVLFHSFVRRVTKDEAFAAFATCSIILLFQFRAFFDPILSFFGMLQLVVAGLLVSLIALQRYIEGGGRRWYALSAGAFLAVLLTYEVCYPLFLLHAVLVWQGRTRWRVRVLLASPFALTAVACAATSVALRWHFLSGSTDYTINTEPVAFAFALARQVSSALPLSYVMNNHAGLYPRIWDAGALLRFIGTPGGLTVFAATLAISYTTLRHLPARAAGFGLRLSVLLWGLGVLVGILPGVLIALSNRYQKHLHFGIGYLPVYAQYFGVGLFLSTLAWYVLSRMPPGGAARGWSRLFTALLIAGVSAVNHRANVVLVDHLEKPPGSPGFNPVVGGVWGCWNRQRSNLEFALHAGLLENVPDHSTLILENDYPSWHNAPHSRYFYAMHARKVLNVVPRKVSSPGDHWFLPKAAPPKASGATYLLRDNCADELFGCIVLSHDPAASGDPQTAGRSELLVFVRHPKLFADGPSPAVALRGKRTAATATSPEFAQQGRELTVLRSGSDWALCSLRSEAGGIAPNSLTAHFGPVSVDWGEGFEYAEAGPGGWWRWCAPRGSLTLDNVTETPRTFRISMLLQRKENGRVVIDSPFFHAEEVVDKTPSRFVREFTLPPGSHKVTFSAEGSPDSELPQSPRRIDFRLINFRFKDRGAAAATDATTTASKWDGGALRR